MRNVRPHRSITTPFSLSRCSSRVATASPAAVVVPIASRSLWTAALQNSGRRSAAVLPRSCGIYAPSSQRAFAAEGKEVVVKVPQLADSVSEGTLGKWAKAVGDSLAMDEVITSIETDKIAIEVRSPGHGILKEISAQEGETVTVGQELCKLNISDKPAAAKKETSAPSPPKPTAATPTPTPTPAAAAPPSPPPTTSASAPPPPPPSSKPVGVNRSEYKERATRMRMRAAERLKGAQNTYAMLTTFQECDMSNLIQMRNEYKDLFQQKHKVKLGFMSAFVRASIAALKDQPIFNAVLDGSEIIHRDYVDVSIAVAAPRGLIVPVIRDADKLSFADIEKTIANLGHKARTDSLSLEDITGGTFTISNGGVYGSMMGTPIINPPQSSILGMHAINERAVVINGEVKVRPIMYLALTYDHRLIDGKEAVTFLRTIKFNVEDPRRLLLDI